MHHLWTKWKDKIIKYALPGLLGLVGLGVVWYILAWNNGEKSVVVASDRQSDGLDADANKDVVVLNVDAGDVVVYVAGGVYSPGVYRLEAGALIVDAINAAGGFSPECDMSATEKTLNLADLIQTGSKVYVPKTGDLQAIDVSGSVSGSGAGTATSVAVPGKISINSASKSELMSLNGIGDVYSQKIIDSRPYSNVRDLATKKVVPEATFEKIKDYISL